jgi:hypothetical protein
MKSKNNNVTNRRSTDSLRGPHVYIDKRRVFQKEQNIFCVGILKDMREVKVCRF